MSIAYDYYICVRDKTTNKFSLFPGTTYKCAKDDWRGTSEDEKEFVMRPRTIYWRSGSFVSRDFTEEFCKLREEDCDEELRKAFTFKDWHDEESFSDELCFLSLSELNSMKADFIRKGYFLVEDIAKYEENPEIIYNDDIFYDRVSPIVYANMCAKKIERHIEKDCEGYEYEVPGWTEYQYYAYPDYDSKEYMIHELQIIMNSYQEGIEYLDDYKNKELVLLQSIS